MTPRVWVSICSNCGFTVPVGSASCKECGTPTEPDCAWSVKLAEWEHSARLGLPLPAPDTLALISVMRRYMAHAETIDHKVKEMLETTGGK